MITQLKSAILGNRRLPKATPPRQPMKPSEARAALGKLASALRAMKIERDASDAATMKLETARSDDHGEGYQSENLPDLPLLRSAAENGQFRARAAVQAANAILESALFAASDLGSYCQEQITTHQQRMEAGILAKLKSARIEAHPSFVRDALMNSDHGGELSMLSNSQSINLSLPVQMLARPGSEQKTRDGKPVATELRRALMPWRTSPIPTDRREDLLTRDSWNPCAVADEIDSFIQHTEAVEKLAGS
jgi:hypothetical protein